MRLIRPDRIYIVARSKLEADMTIVLDHTIVPAHDNEASARFFARIFGLPYEGAASHFAPVRVNETLVLDFERARPSIGSTMPSR